VEEARRVSSAEPALSLVSSVGPVGAIALSA
jgi:hypothetical protein